MRVRFLLISPDTALRESAKREARNFPFFFDAVPSRQHAERLFANASGQTPDFVLIQPPDADHERITAWARRTFPNARAIALLPVSRGVEATRILPAYDPNSCLGGGELALAGPQDAAGWQALMRRLAEGEAAAGDGDTRGIDELIGRSVCFREALDQALKAAADPRQPVLLYGEKGTGKRLFARVIHAETKDTSGSLVHFDCRALTSRGLERALRGEADAGSRPSTVFLEEISALEAGRQTKVLAFLNERKRGALGRGARLPRLIAATAQEAEAGVRAGRLNADLFGWLQKYVIALPPLRERPSDILLLAERFMQRRADCSEGALAELSREVQERLLGHPWPGNIRELFGVLEAALEAAQDESEVKLEHLPDWLSLAPVPQAANNMAGTAVVPGTSAPPGAARIVATEGGVIVDLPDQGIAFEEIERAILNVALRKTDNNVVRAAKLLRLGRGSLRYRLEKYGIVEPRRRRSAKRRPVPADTGDRESILRRAS